MKQRFPFLISIPHGGIIIPEEVRGRIALTPPDLLYYSDPDTRSLYDFQGKVAAALECDISRMVVDLNRPPYTLPPRHRDGVVKHFTTDGKPVYYPDLIPEITRIHKMMMRYYFPYHARIDHLLMKNSVKIAFDCHSMLPVGPPGTKDAGRPRPLICIGNNGDREGEPRKGSLATCSGPWVRMLADAFRDEFSLHDEVAINLPYLGGFITNAHYWHTGIPFVQLEVNRSLYEQQGDEGKKIEQLRDNIWSALIHFWAETSE